MSQTDEKYLESLIARYGKANKKEQSRILDEYVKTTGQHRKYAIAGLGGKRKRTKSAIRRPRKALYGEAEASALLTLSDLFDGICSIRLRAALDVELPGLYTKGFLPVSVGCYQKLMQISPATIDRLLARRRRGVRKAELH